MRPRTAAAGRAGAPPPRTGAPALPPRQQRPQWTAEPERTLDLGEAPPKGPPPRLETAPFRIGEAPPPPGAPYTAPPGQSQSPPQYAPPAPQYTQPPQYTPAPQYTRPPPHALPPQYAPPPWSAPAAPPAFEAPYSPAPPAQYSPAPAPYAPPAAPYSPPPPTYAPATPNAAPPPAYAAPTPAYPTPAAPTWGAPPAPSQPQPQQPRPSPAQPDPYARPAAPERGDILARPAGPDAFRGRPSAAAAATGADPAPTTAPPGTAAPSPQDRAHRLARVLVSDILVYNRAVRDRARAEGTLPSALGPEISKAWELYKSKVGSDLATSTPYFKDALNDLLAEGEEIF
jgi:hypothetical protein